ncbi:hypothetical protein IK146_03445 [Candidatus Saccharibacteria bacterium]|nr:hypothetical protein [Candidatus Saccharibacteria bacterium]
MSTSSGPKRVEIISGPNRFQLTDAFLYTRDEAVEYECKFELRDKPDETSYAVDLKPDSIKYADIRSCDNFEVSGLIYYSPMRGGNPSLASGNYDAKTGTGFLDITRLI